MVCFWFRTKTFTLFSSQSFLPQLQQEPIQPVLPMDSLQIYLQTIADPWHLAAPQRSPFQPQGRNHAIMGMELVGGLQCETKWQCTKVHLFSTSKPKTISLVRLDGSVQVLDIFSDHQQRLYLCWRNWQSFDHKTNYTLPLLLLMLLTRRSKTQEWISRQDFV